MTGDITRGMGKTARTTFCVRLPDSMLEGISKSIRHKAHAADLNRSTMNSAPSRAAGVFVRAICIWAAIPDSGVLPPTTRSKHLDLVNQAAAAVNRGCA